MKIAARFSLCKISYGIQKFFLNITVVYCINELAKLYRMNNLTAAEKCLDECKYIQYITDVSTTRLTDSFIHELSSQKKLNISEVISLTMYYRTFDVTRIAYHGKVCQKLSKLYSEKNMVSKCGKRNWHKRFALGPF
jgi:hypothetical protein